LLAISSHYLLSLCLKSQAILHRDKAGWHASSIQAGGKFYAEKPNGTEPESQNQQRWEQSLSDRRKLTVNLRIISNLLLYISNPKSIGIKRLLTV
jgi:hypothetical protein